MKTEVKMIAAIVAVLAVALTAFVPVADTTDAASNVPAIWPGEYEAADPATEDTGGSVSEYGYILSGVVKDDTEHQFGMWKYVAPQESPSLKAPTEPTTDYPFINAEWIYDEESGYTYWLDETDGGNWFTILGATEVELDGKMVSYRIRYDAPVDAGEPLEDSELQIKFYNDITANPVVDPYYDDPYSANVVVTGIEFKKFNLENSDKIETAIGTVYVTGLQVRLIGNYSFGTADMLGFSKLIYVPVVIQKLNISLFDAEFKYPYNGLWQTPVADYADNENATYYKKGVVVENPTPYAPVDNSFNLAEVQADISEIIGEEITLTLAEDSTVMAYKTNKYVASAAGKDAEPYIIKFTADNEKINGELTITWWIMPLGIDDLQFNIFDPYYNFDQEVRPKVVVTWTEPEDGPRPGYVHMVGADNLDITYISPADYPYPPAVEYVPVYEYVYDSQGNVVMEKVGERQKFEYGEPVYVEATDDDGNPIDVPLLDANGVPVRDEYGTVVTTPYVQAMGVDGKPLYKQDKDGDGNLLYTMLEDEDSCLYPIHVRFYDMSFVYYPMVDEDGNVIYNEDGSQVYDLNNPMMKDEDIGPHIFVPVMAPVFEIEMEDVMEPKYKLDENGEKIPVKTQYIDEYGRAAYMGWKKEPMTYLDGSIAYQQIYKNGKFVDDPEHPIMVTVYDYIMEGEVYTADQVSKSGKYWYVGGTAIPADKFDEYVTVVPAYDEESDVMYVQKYTEEPLDFTATQVGVPKFDNGDYYGRVFDYGIHIVCDSGYYEFDTDDYAPAATESYGVLYEMYYDEDAESTTINEETKLYKPETLVVDNEYELPYTLTVGEVYDEERFIWHILPLQLEKNWLSIERDPDYYKKINDDDPLNDPDKEYMIDIVVPAGYQHQTWDAPESIGNIKVNNPVLTLGESYTLAGAFNYDEENPVPECQYGAEEYYPYNELMGEMEVLDLMIYAYDCGDFYGSFDIISYDGLKWMEEFELFYYILGQRGWGFEEGNSDTFLHLGTNVVEVRGELEVDDIKKNLYLPFVNLLGPSVKAFGPDCFKITVIDSTGDIVVDHDNLVRGDLKTDVCTVILYGNIDAGWVGTIGGVFYVVNVPASTDGFTYVADPDYKNGVRITGYTGDATEIVIPNYIDGKRVTSIGEKAFYGDKDITYVKFGDNVRKVLAKSFANCTNLKAVDFSDSVQRIATYAFYGDKALERVAFGHGLKIVQSNAFSVNFSSLALDETKLEAFEKDYGLYDGFAEEMMEKYYDRTNPQGYYEVMSELFDYAYQYNADPTSVFAGAPVNYVDSSGKTQYDVGKLVGNAFILGEEPRTLVEYMFTMSGYEVYHMEQAGNELLYNLYSDMVPPSHYIY